MNFLTNYLKEKVAQTNVSLTQLIAEFDPQSASEAQIKTVADVLSATNSRLATLQGNVQAAQKAVDADNKAIHDRMEAAGILSDQRKDDKAAILLDEIDNVLNPKLKDDQQALADIQQTVTETEARQKELEGKLRTARQRTDAAQRSMERAKIDRDRAKEQESDARRQAGIDRSVDQLDAASNAMEAAAAKARQEADAARTNAQSLARVAPASASNDADIKAALDQAAGKTTAPTQSVADRLAAMRSNMGQKAA